jgi:hypothetical protein
MTPEQKELSLFEKTIISQDGLKMSVCNALGEEFIIDVSWRNACHQWKPKFATQSCRQCQHCIVHEDAIQIALVLEVAAPRQSIWWKAPPQESNSGICIWGEWEAFLIPRNRGGTSKCQYFGKTRKDFWAERQTGCRPR